MEISNYGLIRDFRLYYYTVASSECHFVVTFHRKECETTILYRVNIILIQMCKNRRVLYLN